MNNDLFNHGIGTGNTISSVIADFNIAPFNNGNYLSAESTIGLSPLAGEGENLYFIADPAHQCDVVKFNIISNANVWTTNLPKSVNGSKNNGTDLKIVDGFLYVVAKQCYKVSLKDGNLLETYELTQMPSYVRNFINPNIFTRARINDFMYDKTSSTVLTKKDLSGNTIKTYKFQNYEVPYYGASHINYTCEQIVRIENFLFAYGTGVNVYWDKTYNQQATSGSAKYMFKFDTDLNLIKQVKLPLMTCTNSSTVNNISMLCTYKKNILMISQGYYGGLQLFTVDRSCLPTFADCDNVMIYGSNSCIIQDKLFAFFSVGTDSNGYSLYKIKGVNLK